jgi:hypothetical protein
VAVTPEENRKWIGLPFIFFKIFQESERERERADYRQQVQQQQREPVELDEG